MYIITFYSFKGGVGRTMAMANVGLSLARAGRRVLLVDFDLEAPGLDTFDLLRPSEPTAGLVDFVTEYRATGAAPDVANFIYEPSHPDLDAKIWVMPTGKQDLDYGRRLNAIDWPRLYAEEDGYLLFEDLKQQWRRAVEPDYVFVDSRTGHTDVGGICTRQLPDAVALLFFPNEQNRRGLEVVVRDIKRECRESGRSIEQYFVAANVPDLDDEDRILDKELARFSKIAEGIHHATIHHYDSLLLLQQTIFTIDRPRTKLAGEYDRLAKIITGANLTDRVVATQFLQSVVRQGVRVMRKPETTVQRLDDIKKLYSEDGPMLYALGEAHRSLGRGKDAEHLFAEAAKLGFRSEENMAEEATKQYSAGDVEAAREVVLKALDLPLRHVFPIARLLSIVAAHDPDYLADVLPVLDTKGLENEDRMYIATRLEVNRKALSATAQFIRPLTMTDQPIASLARSELSLCLIGQRRFSEAEILILAEGQSPTELGIQDCFNYAIASWGKNSRVPKDLFSRVVSLDIESPATHVGSNYLQCLALANWAAGRIDTARELSAKSRSALNGAELEFSAWRYLRVNKRDFRRDLDALDSMITSGQGLPTVFNDSD